MKSTLFVLIGYFSGSVLYARVFANLFKKNDFINMSCDNNPGTSNAFRYGGFWCGVFTLAGDVLKGFFPVFLYMTYINKEAYNWLPVSLIMAAPVIGHAFPVFYGFQGGKGIAVTFGCLLGLLPIWQPLMTLAIYFIFFSVVLRITPHYYRTLAAYICSFVTMIFTIESIIIRTGFMIISSVVILRLLISKENKERIEVKLMWMR